MAANLNEEEMVIEWNKKQIKLSKHIDKWIIINSAIWRESDNSFTILAQNKDNEQIVQFKFLQINDSCNYSLCFALDKQLILFGYIHDFERDNKNIMIPLEIYHTILCYLDSIECELNRFFYPKYETNANLAELYAYNQCFVSQTTDNEQLKWLLLVYQHIPLEFGDLGFYDCNAFTQRIAMTYLQQILNGLDTLHSQNIVHHNLCLENILFDHQLQLKLSQYGIKTIKSDVDKENMKIDNQYYKAPELVLDQTYDERCDIFSVGVILFVMITGC